MMNFKDLKPAIPIHPGELLQDELASRHLPLSKFVNKSGANRRDIVAILQCKAAVTKELAAIIGKALDMDPEIWLNIQNNYDKDKRKIIS
jgi:HTH-type transcriptional regulator/antitoxin HigA